MTFQAALKGIKLDGDDSDMKPIDQLDLGEDEDNEQIELMKAGIGYIEG
jgi:hypothetical protein